MTSDRMSCVHIVLKMVLILLVSIIVGVLLLAGVYLLPTGPMFEHVKESSKAFQLEGYYPVVDRAHNILLDNWTDSVMLSGAVYPGRDEGILKESMLVKRMAYPEMDPVDELLNYVNGNPGNLETQVEAYPRYWHGYQVFLKPLLLFTTYLGIRDINSFLVWLVMLAAVIGFIKQKKSVFMVPFIFAVVFLHLDAIVYSMQFSTSYYVMMLASILILFLHQKLEKRQWYPYVFFLTGIVVAYMDFLTYPLVTLGVPLTLFLILKDSKNWKEELVYVVKYSICWGLGYAGMWSSKWLVASITLDGNYFADAANSIKFRTSSQVSQSTFTYMDVLKRNLSYFTSYKFFLLFMILFLVVVLIIVRKHIGKGLQNMLPYLLICCMPFVWYMVLSNHSYIHRWMTYRTFIIFVFAYLCMGVQVVRRRGA